MHSTAILLLFCAAAIYALRAPEVTVTRLYKEPFFSRIGESIFRYNYNSAFVPTDDGFTMAVRVQDLHQNPKSIYDVGPSAIAITRSNSSVLSNPEFSFISPQSVIISPNDPMQNLGAEDPRIVLHKGTYYMYYSAVTTTSKFSNDVICRLALATCDANLDVSNANNWKLHGALFPNRSWSKSGALLTYNETIHYLFFGDLDITIATSSDLLSYRDWNVTLIGRRADKFDSELVESGPNPLPLSNGNYLFLYNSARKTDIKNPKPNWNLEYNLGYVILDGKNPTKILYRSDEPILSPTLDWEKCDSSTASIWQNSGLTPMVVFVEGWKQIDKDKFLVIYQGCDSFTGFFTLEIKM